MNFNEYQKLARSTAVYPEEHKVVYPALGLCGEAGEVADKIRRLFVAILHWMKLLAVLLVN